MSNISSKVSEAETEVLKVLWANKEPMTERNVMDTLGETSDWSQATIKTLLKRLFDKGVVQREKRDVFYYSPLLSEADFEKGRTEDFVNKVFGGNAKGLLSTMLNNDILSEDDLGELKNYWKNRGKKDE